MCCGPWCTMRKEVGITLENFDFFREFYQLYREEVRVHGAPRAPRGVRTEFDSGGGADEYYALGLYSSGL